MGEIISIIILGIILITFGGFSLKHVIKVINNQFKYQFDLLKNNTSMYQFAVNFKKSIKNDDKFPIIHLNFNGHKGTFLLDTGADTNIIDKKFFDIINKEKDHEIEKSSGLIFGGGFAESPGMTTINFKYGANKFQQSFDIFDMSSAFDSIHSDTGIKLDGLLGSKFFLEYQWILDFEKMVIWVK